MRVTKKIPIPSRRKTRLARLASWRPFSLMAGSWEEREKRALMICPKKREKMG